jgi:hypothetical protein
MKFTLLTLTTILLSVFTHAQDLNKEALMGEWKAINVEFHDSQDSTQKGAMKMIKDAFFNSRFNFKGNTVFNIEFEKLTDKRMNELLFLDNQNWKINKNQIYIGTESNGFSLMHITFQKKHGKTYFILPMIRLEVQKISDDIATTPKIITSKPKSTKNEDYPKSELKTKAINTSDIIRYDDAENPPLAPKCKAKWDVEKRKTCTSKFIRMHTMRTFNTDLVADVDTSGTIKFNIDFVIDVDGKPINIIVNGGPEIMNQNLIDVISSLPALKPGTKHGKPIKVSYEMPFTLRIAD